MTNNSYLKITSSDHLHDFTNIKEKGMVNHIKRFSFFKKNLMDIDSVFRLKIYQKKKNKANLYGVQHF